MFIAETYTNGDPTGLPTLSRRIEQMGPLAKTCIPGQKTLVPGQLNVYKDSFLENNLDYQFSLTMFEATRIQQEWVDIMNHKVGEVIVPHEYSKKAFEDSGVNRPVHVVPLAFEKYERTAPYIPPSDTEPMVIGILGVPVRRKNVEIFIDAVREANARGANAVVRLHAPYFAYVGHYEEKFKDLPFLETTTGFKTREELREWFSSIHAYAFPSSGEGWSFTPREAMYMGIPTIISDIEAHDDLIDSGAVIPIKSSDNIPAYYEFAQGNIGEWREIKKEDMVESILRAREMMGTSDLDRLRMEAKAFVENAYSWEKVFNGIRGVVEPTNVVVLPSLGTRCGIAQYTKRMVEHMDTTKIVKTMDDAVREIQTGNVKDIHVQHEFSFFTAEKLAEEMAKLQGFDVQKTVTLHTAGDRKMTQDVLKHFDRRFVLGSAVSQKANDSGYSTEVIHMPGPDPSHVQVDPDGPVGTFGLIHPQKGYKYVVEATELAQKSYRVAGWLRPEMPTWGEGLEKPHVEHINEFLPWLDIRKAMSGCSMLVFYYHDLPFTYVSASIMDAASLGIPIITSDARAFSELDGCVLKVPSKSPSLLADAIMELSDNKELREQLVTSMDAYLTEHSWKRAAKRFQ